MDSELREQDEALDEIEKLFELGKSAEACNQIMHLIATSNKALLLRLRELMPEKRQLDGVLFTDTASVGAYNDALSKALAVIDAEIKELGLNLAELSRI